jgi:chromosome segregation protein
LYLSKLEIFGFKSFAQKTTINFNEGITSIVGPNGCGKTNIVDAIRWCLGEQKSSALRSDKMENVIFNGTANKKPMGMAEVSLTIENTKGILPIEYSDITITRRIFRSGESEYLLNKNLCRLKDITNLFMDTGIGANAYSVIELKMVETILSSKAEERRIMFEEAAGVNKYKLRRRLALRKLDEVKNDLNRVNDIVEEVNKNVNSLARQAKKAEKYNHLSSTLKELELDLAEREMALYFLQLDKYNNQKESHGDKKNQLDSEIAKYADELRLIKQNLREIERKLKKKREKVTGQTENIYSVKNNIAVSVERKNSLNTNIERYFAEIEELEKRLYGTKDSIQSSNKSIDEISLKRNEKEDEKDKLQNSIEQHNLELESRREKVRQHREVLVENLKELGNKQNELSNINKALQDKNDSIGGFNDKVLQLTNDVAKTVGFIESLKEERKTAADNLAEAETTYTKKQAEKEQLENKLNKLRTEELDLKGYLNGLNDKIIFVQNIVDNLEGISKGTKSLLENTEWAGSNAALMANVGNSSEEYKLAIEAALKNNLNNIIISTFEDLKSALNYLEENDSGRASFFINAMNGKNGETIGSRLIKAIDQRRARKIEKSKSFIGWTADLIETDTKWIPSFKKVLKNIAVVNQLIDALELSRRYANFSFVTLEGEYADSLGVVEGGSPPKIDESLFGKKHYLDDLKEELPGKNSELIELQKDIKKCENDLGAIDLRILSDKGKMLVNEVANIDKQLAQIEFEREKANDEIEKIHKQIKELAENANEIDNSKNFLSEELQKISIRKEEIEAAQNEMEAELIDSEQQHNKLISSHHNVKLELERFLGEIRSFGNRIEQAEINVDTIDSTISGRKTDIEIGKKEIEQLNISIESKNSELKNLENVKSQLLTEERSIEENYTELNSQSSAVEEKQNKIRTDRDIILDEIRDAEIKLNEISIKKQNLIEHIDEEYSIVIEQKRYDDLDTFDFIGRKNEVHNLRQNIRSLGPINLLAFSEYDEEKGRLDFLINQKNDLVESERDIVNTIDEINRTAQTKFLDTFNEIRENFIRVFRTLFDPGDEVDLSVEENVDPLEAKIDITAKPRGKRPTSIELLSGGEKTLTAIALLFAIYLVKPSPFCILDEIDAPLDDANIDRFTRILNDFSEETQFIVVTHNNRTMESAETLYGVTMQEEGISKLVSVQFNEEFDFVAK